MSSITRTLSRWTAMFLVCALLAPCTAVAAKKPLTPETVHARILKRGVGNWIGVELQNGTAFAGRIVSINDQSFGLQLHNGPEVTAVQYSDVVDLRTGIGQGAFWTITVAGIAGVVVMALVAHHEMARQPTLPTQPVLP